VFLLLRQKERLLPLALLHPDVRRQVALPKPRQEEFLERSLYVLRLAALLRDLLRV